MFVEPHAPRSRSFLVLSLAVALGLVAPVCGKMTARQRKLSPPKVQAPASKIVGFGLNCHAERLPLDKLRALGVKWVRLDTGGLKLDDLPGLVDYYKDFGQMWTDHQMTHNPVGFARKLVDCGVSDIEVYNEPEQNGISPSEYAREFRAVRNAVGTRARLYGPAVGNWPGNKGYLNACLDAGMLPDVISFHGYDESRPEDFNDWVSDARRYGVPVVITELAFPDYNGPAPYRIRMNDSLESLVVRTHSAVSATAWCFYDGPNPDNNNDNGIFDYNPRTHRFDIPNAHYQSLLRATSRFR